MKIYPNPKAACEDALCCACLGALQVPVPPPDVAPLPPTYARGQHGAPETGRDKGWLDIWDRPWRAHAYLVIKVSLAGISRCDSLRSS